MRFILVDPMVRLMWTEQGRWARTLNFIGLDPHGAETRLTAAVRVDGPVRACPGAAAASRARLEERVAGLRRAVEAVSCP
jgi:hypothetical protein